MDFVGLRRVGPLGQLGHVAQKVLGQLVQTRQDGVARDGVARVLAGVQITRLRPSNRQRRVGAGFLPSRRREHSQVQVIQSDRRTLDAQARLPKVAVDQVKLLKQTHAQYGARVVFKTYGCCPAIRSVAELDDAVAIAVTGLRVHATAFHQGQACKVIGLEVVAFCQSQYFAFDRGHLAGLDKAFVHRAAERAVQHWMRFCARAVAGPLDRSGRQGVGRHAGAVRGLVQLPDLLGNPSVQVQGPPRRLRKGGAFQVTQLNVLACEDQVGVVDAVAGGDLLCQAQGLRIGQGLRACFVMGFDQTDQGVAFLRLHGRVLGGLRHRVLKPSRLARGGSSADPDGVGDGQRGQAGQRGDEGAHGKGAAAGFGGCCLDLVSFLLGV